jgi:hypothetical protein
VQDPPERPKNHNKMDVSSENFQLWSLSRESCPEGTIPIRRTTEQDMLRASSINTFGRKLKKRVRRDTNSNGHEVYEIQLLKIYTKKMKLLFIFQLFQFFWLSSLMVRNFTIKVNKWSLQGTNHVFYVYNVMFLPTELI